MKSTHYENILPRNSIFWWITQLLRDIFAFQETASLIMTFIRNWMWLMILKLSGVSKNHPRRGLFSSLGARSGKVNYRWDILQIFYNTNFSKYSGKKWIIGEISYKYFLIYILPSILEKWIIGEISHKYLPISNLVAKYLVCILPCEIIQMKWIGSKSNPRHLED